MISAVFIPRLVTVPSPFTEYEVTCALVVPAGFELGGGLFACIDSVLRKEI